MATITVQGVEVQVSTLSQVDDLITYSSKSFLKNAFEALKKKVSEFGNTINPEREIYQKALLEVESAI